MRKQTQPQLKALFSTTLREGVRRWLAGVDRKKLPGRAELGQNNVPKRYKQVILAVLGLKSWPEALRVRTAARAAAKKAAKEAKSDAASQRRAA